MYVVRGVLVGLVLCFVSVSAPSAQEIHTHQPGTAGIVRTGDTVVHSVTSDEPVHALVIWTPGGEAGRIAPGLSERPIEP